MASEAETRLSLPQRWNDRALLREEPFLTEFALWDSASERRGRGEMYWPRRVADSVLKFPGGVRTLLTYDYTCTNEPCFTRTLR